MERHQQLIYKIDTQLHNFNYCDNNKWRSWQQQLNNNKRNNKHKHKHKHKHKPKHNNNNNSSSNKANKDKLDHRCQEQCNKDLQVY